MTVFHEPSYWGPKHLDLLVVLPPEVLAPAAAPVRRDHGAPAHIVARRVGPRLKRHKHARVLVQVAWEHSRDNSRLSSASL